MVNIIVTTSWDDGHILDIKLAELLKKYQARATFYVCPKNREFKSGELLSDEQVRRLGEDFEIGAHTMTHPRLDTLPLPEAEKEISESKKYLERVTNRPVSGFCYPGGAFQPIHTGQIKKLGFRYARTTSTFSLNSGGNPYEMQTSIHAYDHWTDAWKILKFVHFNPIEFFRFFRRWDQLAIAIFDRILSKGGIFHLWGHSWEIEKNNDWDRLEKVLAHLANRANVRYLSNREIYG